MPIKTTYTQARANLAKLIDEVAENCETVVIERRRGGSVAMISAAELAALTETAHLLRSPRNAERLLGALARARRGRGRALSVAQLRHQLGLEDPKT